MPRFQTKKKLSSKTSSMVEITIILFCINMNSCRTTTKKPEISYCFHLQNNLSFCIKLPKCSRLKVLQLAQLPEKLVQCFFLWTWPRACFLWLSSILLSPPFFPSSHHQPWRCCTAISWFNLSCHEYFPLATYIANSANDLIKWINWKMKMDVPI